MALTSPGVEVKVIDESFYTPAAPGSVPLIIVATAENKSNASGNGIAKGTLKANSGQAYLITSQRDLVDTFGDPLFKTDASLNPVHAGEQNEYGLQAAYSLLGSSNRAFVVRADINLDQLSPSVDAPSSEPVNGTYWLDTQTTRWGIFEWDDGPVSAGGQKFVNKTPITITDPIKVDAETGGPAAFIGKPGNYAVILVDSDETSTLTDSHPLTLWYKNANALWTQVGSDVWSGANTSGESVVNVSVLSGNSSGFVNGEIVTFSQPNILGGVSATGTVVATAGALTGITITNPGIGYTSAPTITFTTGTLGTGSVTAVLSTTLPQRSLAIGPHTVVPQWKRTSPNVTIARTGSVWVKTTEPNLGARWRTSRYNESTKLFEATQAALYASSSAALVSLDKTGGGLNLPVGQLYVKYNQNPEVSFTIYRKKASGSTIVKSNKILANTFTSDADVDTAYSFSIKETITGGSGLSISKNITVTIPAGFTTTAQSNAEAIAQAINAAGLVNVEATIDNQNRLNISHRLGGDMQLTDGENSPLEALGFAAFNSSTGAGVLNLYAENNMLVASLWEPLVYFANEDPPNSLTEDGTLWYSSVIDEIDMMVHDGDNWVGYLTQYPESDPSGPIVSATEPKTQSDSSNLVSGDLWIDTSDIENFPTIYKYNADLALGRRWVQVDTSDQSTEDGIVFADARYSTSGASSEQAAIADLLTSNYLDPDAPDPALYPKGMLLWNLRRSGFNVKEFKLNYIDITLDNPRFNDASMVDYYPHRWVTVSSNDQTGKASLGRKAQRIVVVRALQALVNSNQQIREEESRVFNLIACPGYPELINEMVTLNVDRGLTAFVIGDSPARLTADATSLLNWGTNQNLSLDNNDMGAVTYDEYMAMFYPWGFSSDNFGNNIAVPPSHMMLKTIILNDQVAYPWFAPAGLRRGGITNATAVGYVDGEGEFKSVALNNGQRDTLYEVKVNPITFFTGAGLVNYGQKTRAKAASALDRINVARLVIYLRGQLNRLAKPYVFEPNDKLTRDELKGAVESLLLELVGQRALYDYLVVCDESNNTPSRIDRNELWIDIAIEPVKAVEFIYIPLRLKNTGEISGI